MSVDDDRLGCLFDIKVNPDVSFVAKLISRFEVPLKINGIVNRFDSVLPSILYYFIMAQRTAGTVTQRQEVQCNIIMF